MKILTIKNCINLKAILTASLLIFFGYANSSICKAQTYKQPKAPEWVVMKNPKVESKVSKYDINSGYYLSRYNSQTNLVTNEDYTLVRRKILTSAGVSNGSEISISFDSTYQTVEINSYVIYRGKKRIDRLEELEIEVLNNETGLESSIYSGKVMLYSILKDIRKNDEVEFSYTIKGVNPIFDTDKYQSVSLQGYDPMDYVYVSILYPKEEKYGVHARNFDPSLLQTTTSDKYTTVVYESLNEEAAVYESGEPDWYSTSKRLSVGNRKNWGETIRWAHDVFNLDKIDQYKNLLDEVITDETTTEAKINAAINFVQGDIRYMGIESGIGSIQPFMPDVVMDQRFGDCKDKSLLLVSLLRAIGVEESYPALVNTNLLFMVDSLLPTGHIFNHCIVNFSYKGQEYWVDPTNSQQGGPFDRKAMFNYYKALVVDRNLTDLKDFNLTNQISKTVIKERFQFKSFKKDGTLTVITKHYGSNADYFRNKIEYSSMKDISDQYKEYYEQLYPKIEAEKIIRVVEDDLEANVITLEENYILKGAFEVSDAGVLKRYTFSYEPISLYDFMSASTCTTRESPVTMNFPSEVEISALFSFPMILDLEEEDLKESNVAFDFEYKQRNIGKKITKVFYSYKAKKDYLTAAEFNKLCPKKNKILDQIPFEFYFNK